MTEAEKKRLNYLSHISWRTIDNEIWKKTVNLVKNPPNQTLNKFGQGETADISVAATGKKMSSIQCDEEEMEKKLETEWSHFLKQNQELLE